MDGFPHDVRPLWYEMKNHKKDLRRKRLYLMGFPEPAGSSKKRLRLANKESMLPETMLREDDLFCESLKKLVEKGFGVCYEPSELPVIHDVEPVLQHKLQKTILARIDDFTNNGLYLLAKVIAGSSVVFEKTRRKMKKFIKENMAKVLEKQGCNDKEGAAYKLSQILKVPQNYRKKHAMIITPIGNSTICTTPTVQSQINAIMIVFNRLKDMSLQTLYAMYRRLTCENGILPVLTPSRIGWSKSRLISRLESLSQDMLSKCGSVDELPEPLIKATEVACLSLKVSGHQDASVSNFCNHRPEIVSLQNEIYKAINLLTTKVGVQQLMGLKELLSPGSDSKATNNGVRKEIKRILTEFLFECSDMDEIPTLLLDTLSVINRCAGQPKDVAKEVENILNVSAHIKEIFWDIWADDELDLDYNDAYMDDLEESDDGDFFDDYVAEEEVVKNNLDEMSEVGSTADSHVLDSHSSHFLCTPTLNVNSRSVAKSESACKSEVKADPDSFLFTPSAGVSKSFNHTVSVDSKLHQQELSKHMLNTKGSVPHFSLSSTPNEIPSRRRNKYLALQHVSDETSLFAYRLIGHVMEGYARSEKIDLDRNQLSYLNAGHKSLADPQVLGTVPNEDEDGLLLIKAVRELIPSFPLSELEKALSFRLDLEWHPSLITVTRVTMG